MSAGTGSCADPGAGSTVGVSTGSEAGSEAARGTCPGTGSVAREGTGSCADPGAGSAVGVSTGSEAEPGAGRGVGPQPGSGAGPGADLRTGSGTEVGNGSGTGLGTRAGTGCGSGSEVGAEARCEEETRLGRAFLTRVLEPGDGTGGRWVRELGVETLVRRLREGGEPLPGVSGKRWAGLLARAERADPRRDLAVARDAGVRFVCPGAAEWPGQLDDLGDARPLGLWVRGTANLRMWALRSVAVVGARACT
ncbi:hypothetical protein ACWEGV_28240, partial [Streptomyces sp. NPDC004976]